MKAGFALKKSTKTVKCGEYTCRIKHGGESAAADLTLFTGRSVEHYQSPPARSPEELWVFQSSEPQWIKAPLQNTWDGLFNYSVTYLHGSEGAQLTFAKKLLRKANVESINFAAFRRQRKFNALWLVSHCTQKHRPKITSARAMYVLELANYIQIDVFTARDSCREQLGALVKNVSKTRDQSMKGYTFYLAFENSLCEDYITEKLWKVLEAKPYTIPVALGGLSIEEYRQVAPPNSFIHVKNFTSPKALADHLKHVAENDDAFNYYMQWRNEYRIIGKGYPPGRNYLFIL